MKGVIVDIDEVIENAEEVTKEQIAAALVLTQMRMKEARKRRVRAIKEARELGLTNAAIGEVLGITEARVRQLAKQ